MNEPQAPTNEEARHAMPAGLLHDLRTELDPIIGYATILMELAHEEGQDGFVPDLQTRIHKASATGWSWRVEEEGSLEWSQNLAGGRR